MKRALLLASSLLLSIPACMSTDKDQRIASARNEGQPSEKGLVENKNEEFLVNLHGHYGTGMAHATLDVSTSTPRTVTATVTWHVSPPPCTPDTAVCSFNFAIDPTAVDTIVVIVISDQMDKQGGSERTQINTIIVPVTSDQKQVSINLNN
jgi:hypothetical protein